jgi:hypothetical protein
MIRFAWLQCRTQTVLAVGALVLLAIVLAVTGPHLVHLYDTDVATCGAHGDCSTAITGFLRNDNTLREWLDILVIVTPGIIGIFWGAPLVARELETGTYRLAWTQSVTRSRWLGVKLGLVGLAGISVAALLSLMVTWWASPIDRVNANRFTPGVFDERGIVAIGYAAFGFALGVGAGVLIRRSVPAMATTLGAFLGTRLAFTYWVRPHLVAPAHLSVALNPTSMGYGSTNSGPATLMPNPPNIPNAWIYSTHIVDRLGHGLTAQLLARACPRLGRATGGPPPGSGHSGTTQVPAGVQAALQDCVTKVGVTFHEVVTYQPADRYWTFQWYETAIFLGAALVLAGACLWWIRRRFR